MATAFIVTADNGCYEAIHNSVNHTIQPPIFPLLLQQRGELFNHFLQGVKYAKVQTGQRSGSGNIYGKVLQSVCPRQGIS